MPDLSKLKQIEAKLLSEMEAARQRYEVDERHRNEYQQALRRFNDFTINRKVPDDLNDKSLS